MKFNDYQIESQKTAIYPEHLKIIYPALGLAGETGEVCDKIKKIYRDHGGEFTEGKIEEIKKELGDVLWYIQAIAQDLGLSFNDIAESNLEKLHSRKIRKTISGTGDNR